MDDVSLLDIENCFNIKRLLWQLSLTDFAGTKKQSLHLVCMTKGEEMYIHYIYVNLRQISLYYISFVYCNEESNQCVIRKSERC